MVVVDVKHIASVSFGKDSLAMLLRLIEEQWPLDTVLFYNTGVEFESIYKIRDKIIPALKNKGIDFVELRAEDPFMYSMLERKIKYKHKEGYHTGYGWCGGACRWGTTYKRDVIQKYKRGLDEPVTDYIGIAADETKRFEKGHSSGTVMPLVEWGMTEADCLQYCRERGWAWTEKATDGFIDLYDILDRVSCWCCRNKNLKELRLIYETLPEYWEKLKALQEKIPEPMKGVGKSVFELEKRFELQKDFEAKGKKTNTKEFYATLSSLNKGGQYRNTDDGSGA